MKKLLTAGLLGVMAIGFLAIASPEPAFAGKGGKGKGGQAGKGKGGEAGGRPDPKQMAAMLLMGLVFVEKLL